MRDERPGTLVGAIGFAILINSLVFVIVYFFVSDARLFWRIVFTQPILFILCLSLPYAHQWKLDWHARSRASVLLKQSEENELERLRIEFNKLKAGEQVRSEASEALIDADLEALRRARWRQFWIEIMTYVIDHNSIVSWRDKDGNGLHELIRDYQTWRQSFVIPFIKHDPPWLSPVYQGGKTRLNTTAAYILNRLSAGDLPPLPHGEPAKLNSRIVFEKHNPQAKDSENNARVFETV